MGTTSMNRLRLEVIPPTGRWRAFQRSRYKLLEDATIGRYTVPAGFVTDGASLPPLVRGFFDPLGEWGRAAVLHDYLLSIGTERDQAAHEFRETMKDDGVTPAARQIFYWAVRVWDNTGAKF